MHINLLEDDVAIQEMLRLVLQDEGYTVTIFPTAEEFLNTLLSADLQPQSPPADLLIVDWRLPGLLSGIQVIQQIRAIPRFQSLPIILTTAATFNDTQALEGLQVTLLEKPFAIDDMVSLIKSLALPRSTTEC